EHGRGFGRPDDLHRDRGPARPEGRHRGRHGRAGADRAGDAGLLLLGDAPRRDDHHDHAGDARAGIHARPDRAGAGRGDRQRRAARHQRRRDGDGHGHLRRERLGQHEARHGHRLMPEVTGTLKTPRLATAPGSPSPGQMYYDTGTNVLYWWNGTAWIPAMDAGGGAPTEDALHEGVIAAGDCLLTVNSSNQVTVAAGVAWVRNAAGVLTRTTPVSTLLGVTAAAASNFRLDQVVF